MTSIRIDRLSTITPQDVGRLITGYTSSRRYEIQVAETDELASIELVLQELDRPYEKTWTYGQDMVRWFQGVLGRDVSFGAWHKDRLVGIAIVDITDWNSTAMVCELHVDPAYRRRGIGRELLDRVEEAARSSGMRVVSIETQSTNVDAIDFYRAVGYSVGGVDLSYYSNDDLERGEIAIFMKKPLD